MTPDGRFMRVSIVGTGYVGLVSGVCLASLGFHVVCVDSDTRKAEMIRAGNAPIHEEALDELLASTIGSTLEVTTDLDKAVAETDLTIVAVGTPSTPNGIDLTQIRAAVRDVGRAIAVKQQFHIVVIKSTVVPGTTDTVLVDELEHATGGVAGVDFGIGVNPEFLTEGTAVADFLQPDRIVIGAEDERTERAVRQLYRGFENAELIVTNMRTAEMIKYASNALLATAISFSNEMANLGAAIGRIDTVEVMRGVSASRYLTERNGGVAVRAELASFLSAGCGFGGSCLPKDVSALAAEGARRGVPMRILDSVLAVNREQPRVLVDVIRRELGELSEARIGILGLAFKPETDDTRESPAFPLIRMLGHAGAKLIVHDPVVKEAGIPESVRGLIERRGDLLGLLRDVDAVVLITSWRQYLDIPKLVASLPDPPLVVDGRRLFSSSSVPRYAGIGL